MAIHWTEYGGGWARHEILTDDGELHVTVRPVSGVVGMVDEDELDDETYNPVCGCPRVPADWCQRCGGCAACGECSHRPGRSAAGTDHFV